MKDARDQRHGRTRYEPAREQFAENFASHKEVGAVCAVLIGGELVLALASVVS
jgi:hypothetical protein